MVYTPDQIAKDIIKHFNPTGRCLDPCMGSGAFYQYLPSGSEWCEIERGRDFFQWKTSVDWIVSNPPLSTYYEFLQHSFSLSGNVVFLMPLYKCFQSMRNMKLIHGYGGIKEIYIVGTGRSIGWNFGFAVGAFHFKEKFRGCITLNWRDLAQMELAL